MASNRGGKRPNAGRKSKAAELGLTALLNKCWTREDREECIMALAQKAKNPRSKGFMDAVKLLMAYAFGRPAEKHELSNPDGTPLMSPVADALTKVYGTANRNPDK